jgi:hypothetical protein
MNIKDIETRIAELQAELKVATANAQVEREALRKATKRRWKFTFAPANDRQYSFSKNRDALMELWYLQGEVVNREECTAAGWSDDTTRTGGMGYWFNRASGHIAFNSGGGNIYINDGSFRGEAEANADAEIVFKALEQFIIDNPQGGDVTDIILAQRHFGWK